MYQNDSAPIKYVKDTFLEFLEDGGPHSLKEFERYLSDRNIKDISRDQYNNAISFLVGKGKIKRVGRGIYVIGNRENEEANTTNEIKRLLIRVKRELASPINIISLSETDKNLILDIQHMYEECNRLIKKIDEGGEQ